MTEEFRFDPIDILRFMPVALRQATRKGYLEEIKKGNEIEKKYFVLCGNMLYSFTKENDPSTLCGIMFLESSILKIVTNLGSLALSVSAVGGKTVLLTSPNQTELVEWMKSIEDSKYISLSRNLEDMEAQSIQLRHQVEQHEVQSQEYSRSFIEMKDQMKAQAAKAQELEDAITNMKDEARELKHQLKSVEKERSLLLKSRGITPKEMPLWALSEQPRGGVQDMPESIKIWTGTWNLGSNEPFAGMDKARAQRLLQPFVPPGYDIYVLGVQECVSDSVFDSLNGLLEAEGCRRLRLESFNNASDGNGLADMGSPSLSAPSGSSLAAPLPSCTGLNNTSTVAPGDLSKLVGRGDGSLMSMKYTGVAIYVHVDILPDVRLLSITNIPFSSTHSRGGVAVALSIMGRTVAFVCCQLDLKSNDTRKDQYQSLLTGLGTQLAEQGFHLNEQFHHVIWCGDFSFTLVDTSGNKMPPETVVKMLQDGRLFRTLFETHDQLNQEKKDKNVFFGYREAAPFPNFYPTYKKVENRNPVDYTNPSWVLNTYQTFHKAPFYKGGKVKEFTPCFSDRILYHSMVDLAEDLLPECLPVEMNVFKGSDSPSSSSSRSSGRSRNGSSGSDRSAAPQTVQIVGAGLTPMPKTIAVVIDNYRSVNDGEGLNGSDHSPVFATFILRLRHNFEKILQDSVNHKSTGSIGTVLNALSQGNQSVFNFGKDGNKAPKTVEFPMNDDMSLNTPPRSKSSRHNNPSTEPTKKRSGLSHALSAAPVVTEVPSTPSQSVPRSLKYSLLPPGIYRIRISGLKLIWGMNEETPASVSLLFPSPFEAVAGERFVDFSSDTEVVAPAVAEDDAFSLASLNTSFISDNSAKIGAISVAGSYSTSTNTSNSDIYSTPSRGTSQKIQTTQMAASAPVRSPRNHNTATTPRSYELWERTAVSRTGTSLALSAGAYYRQQGRQSTEKSLSRPSSSAQLSSSSKDKPIAPLILTWRGAEPLDKLHLSLRVCIPAFAFSSSKSRPTSTARSNNDAANSPSRTASSDGGEDFITGHCAIGMEQLCKVAMVSSGGMSGCVTVTRMLVNQGRPMYNIDARSLQREMVTLCCSMELLPNV